MRGRCDFDYLRRCSVGRCVNGYNLWLGVWNPAILGDGKVVLFIIDNEISINVSAFSVNSKFMTYAS